MTFTKEEILKISGAALLKDSTQQKKFTISTDTRTIREGDLYLPLRGANFDGEDFLEQAVKSGAAGVFVTKDCCPDNAGIVFKVEDTLRTYLELAQFNLSTIKSLMLSTIAITGSSGKTTTKEMVAAVTAQQFKTHKTFSNHNNEIGFCQTVLSMPEDTEVLILEMGMRGLGEIELLSKYSEPDFAIITNVGSAHVGRLGSPDNIAKAKCEIVKHLHGTLIAHDDEKIRKQLDEINRSSGQDFNRIFYSLALVEILEKKQGYSRFLYKAKEYELNIEGDYNVENSLAAIEIGYKLGMTYEQIKAGLADYRPIEKRWEVQDVSGFRVINDSYNANPESMKASVMAFAELYENPVVILGDMGELGADEAQLHAQVGRYLVERLKGLKVEKVNGQNEVNLESLVSGRHGEMQANPSTIQSFNPSTPNVKFLTVGGLAREIAGELEKYGVWVKSFDNNPQAVRYILENPDIGNTIFLKASRSMKFEEIIEGLKGRFS